MGVETGEFGVRSEIGTGAWGGWLFVDGGTRVELLKRGG